MLKHISYSQYNTYVSCPRSWYLSKVVQAEEKQTWYLPIGTAVHEMVEDHLSATLPFSPAAEDYFFPLIARQMEVEPDLSKWLAGGSLEAPVTGDLALQQVKDCFEKALTFLDEIDVWQVEYDASGRLPGLDVEIKAFIDIIGEHKKHGPVILDWKTGSSKPKNAFQLETYKALLETQTFSGKDDAVSASLIDKGIWAMLKPGTSKARPVDLSKVEPREVGAKYQKVYEKMNAKLYPTDHGFGCKFCFQQDNCLINAGPTDRAKYYDKAHEDGYPF